MPYKLVRGFILFIIFFSVHFNLFCSGASSGGFQEYLYPHFNKYINGKVSEIIQSEDGTYRKQTYTYLENGIIIILFEAPSKSVYICYNEYYNNNIDSEIKLNEIIQLAYISYIGEEELAMNFEYKNNSVEINIEHSRILSITEHRLILTFDEISNRLIKIDDTYKMSRFNDVEYHFGYEYDIYGRLIGIYVIYDWGRILKTAYYYDGIFRTIPRPYYSRLDTPNTDEVVIYDGSKIKYHLRWQLYRGRGGVDSFNTIERQEANTYYVVFEYDENINEVKQDIFFEKNDYYIENDEVITYTVNCISLDDNNNWTHIQVFRDNELYREVFREIKYD